jgi:hypothetical protein
LPAKSINKGVIIRDFRNIDGEGRERERERERENFEEA